jgi:hypothetical protein
VWTGALNPGPSHAQFGLPSELTDAVEDCVYTRVRYPIKNIPAISPVQDQPGFAQDGQMLGDERLPKAEVGFQVADTVFSIAQDLEDRQAGRMGQHFKVLRLDFERQGVSLRRIYHIQLVEYDSSMSPGGIKRLSVT